MFLESFKEYLSTTKLTFSYKPVLVLTLLDVVDRYGKASHAMLIGRFHAFYLERQRQGLPPEKERILYPSPLIKPDEVSDAQVWQILVRYPLELMDEFISVNEDYVRIKSALWSQMTATDLIELKEIALRRIQAYYDDNG